MPTYYYVCEYCKNQFSRPKKTKTARFCSRRCLGLGTVAGKNKNRVPIACIECGAQFEVPQCQITYRKTCSKRCLGKHQSKTRSGVYGVGESNPMYKSGISMYRRRKKKACERCAETRKLLVHHKNRDREDNRDENLETLCYGCHVIEHYDERPRDTETGRFTSCQLEPASET